MEEDEVAGRADVATVGGTTVDEGGAIKLEEVMGAAKAEEEMGRVSSSFFLDVIAVFIFG